MISRSIVRGFSPIILAATEFGSCHWNFAPVEILTFIDVAPARPPASISFERTSSCSVMLGIPGKKYLNASFAR